MKVHELNPGEAQWLNAQLEVARALAEAYTGTAETPPTLKRLDSTWEAWQRERATSQVDANSVINALGIALGQHLVNDLSLRWVIATDEYGTDLAVLGQPGNILMYPANLLAKRVGDESSPIGTLHREALDRVRELRKHL